MNEEINLDKQLKMSYRDYVDYLLEKYGIVPYNYFYNENCKSVNRKNSRTKDGLNIHHIWECEMILLANPHVAKEFPYEFQLSNALVYANLLEHLLLHIKITEEFFEKHHNVGVGGIIMITEQVNDYFGNLPKEPTGWRLNMFNAIRNQYADYITILKYINNINNEDIRRTLSKYNLAAGWDGHIYSRIKKDIKDSKI